MRLALVHSFGYSSPKFTGAFLVPPSSPSGGVWTGVAVRTPESGRTAGGEIFPGFRNDKEFCNIILNIFKVFSDSMLEQFLVVVSEDENVLLRLLLLGPLA